MLYTLNDVIIFYFPASRVISKQISTASSVTKRYSHISVHSHYSDRSSTIPTAPLPMYDEDHYVIIPPGKNSATGKVSQPILPSTKSPPAKEQYVYYAIEDYRPNKEGYVRLTAGESVEVLDKSNPKEWVIATVGNEERPSEEGLVPAKILSAEYIPVRYDSLQGESFSGSSSDDEQHIDERSLQQLDEPPPIPPNHPNREDDVPPTVGSHDANEKETSVSNLSTEAEVSLQSEHSEDPPQVGTKSESPVYDQLEKIRNLPTPEISVTMEEREDEDESKVEDEAEDEAEDEDEDASSEQSDTTPIVSPRGSLHSGSNRSSPMVMTRDPLPSSHGKGVHLLSKSFTAVELSLPSKRKGIVSGLQHLQHYGSDPSLQEANPLSDSSPAFSIPNLNVAAEGGNSPMHERVSSILRESLMSSARNRHHSFGQSSSLERKRPSVTSPIVAELKDVLSRTHLVKSSDAGADVGSKTASYHDDRSLSISPEDALSEVKKLQQESVEVCLCV